MNGAARYRAAAALVRQGWTQGQLAEHTPDGRYLVCAIGAINMATYGDADWRDTDVRDRDYPEVVFFGEAMGLSNPRTGEIVSRAPMLTAVVDWNNAVGRTAQEVSDALEMVAMLAEAEERPVPEPVPEPDEQQDPDEETEGHEDKETDKLVSV